MTRRKTSLLLALLLVMTIVPARILPPLAAPLAHAALSGSNFVPAAFALDARNTYAVATGDVNGDGHLDIVLGNSIDDESVAQEPSQLYLNNGTVTPFAGVTPINIGSGANTRAVALGDVNNDGHLDLVLGNNGQASQLYLNNKQTENPFADVSSINIGNNANTRAVALGDVNNDGHLDLVLGNYGQASKLYLNNKKTENPFADVSSINIGNNANTQAVALGDVNNDGRLDLVLGNDGQRSKLYLNNKKIEDSFDNAHSTFIGSDATTTSVALGDVNGDGRLDLVLGNFAQPSQLYLNNGVAEDPFANVKPTDIGSISRAVALGDVDGDGDLDLVLGNFAQTSQLYLNNGETEDPFARATPTDLGSREETLAVALGDVDSDGDLDLVLGNGIDDEDVVQKPSQLYLNNGEAEDPFANVKPTDIGSSTYASAVALGDVDGDGDLDLVLGDYGQASQLYLNNGETEDPFANVKPTDIVSATSATALALGDVNGDGALDLVLGSGQLYLNNKETENPFAGVTPTNIVSATSATALALGDVNSDGHLDLVLGNSRQPSQLYLNNGTEEPFALVTPIDIESDAETQEVALGDVNGDGRLDLVLGNSRQPSQLYLNNGTEDSFDHVHSTAIGSGANTYAVTLGDVNGDGRLDLVLGNFSQPSQLYLNNGTVAPFAGVTSTDIGGDANTTAVALGDVNGDGHLDLVLGNSIDEENIAHELSQLYLNNGNTAPFAGVTPTDIGSRTKTEAVALGDVNGDGDLDIVLGNIVWVGAESIVPTQLYLQPGPMSRLPNNPPSVSVRRPGARDDAAGTDSAGLFSASRIISNTQVINIPFSLADPEGELANVRAEYSLDGGGRWQPALPVSGKVITDLVTLPQRIAASTPTTNPLGSSPQSLPLVVSLPQSPSPIHLVDIAVTVSVSNANLATLGLTLRSPDGTKMVQLAEPGDLVGSGSANITFSDAAAIPITSGTLPYTATYHPREPLGSLIGISPGGTWNLEVSGGRRQSTSQVGWSLSGLTDAHRDYLFPWDLQASGVYGQSDNVVVRLIASSSYKPVPNQVAGSFPYSAVAATTFPFRVRGTTARVQERGQPVSGALVYRLQPPALREVPTLTNWQTGAPLRSDTQGYVASRDSIRPGDQLFAMREVISTTQYTLYATSAKPKPDGLQMTPAQGFGDQTLEILPDQRLLLFPLTVSLEWDARADPAYTTRLEADLRRASELLYTWTGGQAALGQITIAHGKERWADADVQIYASNRVRPNADQGGIVNDPISETVQTGHTLRYSPGQVRMGVLWNRYGSSNGALGEDWPRALAHELGHYLFFLDDSYLGLDDDGRLISVDDCFGAMNDPYRSDFDSFRPVEDWLPVCKNTLPNRSSGRSDWATINRFYRLPSGESMLQEPDVEQKGFSSPAGPRILPLAFTQFQEVAPAAPQPLGTQFVTLTRPGNVRYLPGDRAQAVLFGANGARLTELGRPTTDLLELRGGREGDKICVFDPLSQEALNQPARRYEGCATVIPEGTVVTMKDPSTNWPPDIHITPVNTTTLLIEAHRLEADLKSLFVRHYPARSAASAALSMDYDATSGVYYATITAPANEPLQNGYLRLWVEGDATRRETIVAYGRGGSPARKGDISFAPVLSPDGQVIVHSDVELGPDEFYILHTTPATPAPPAWGLPVGPAYAISLSGALSDALAKDQSKLISTTLNFSYFDDDVARELEPGLTLAFSNTVTGSWEFLPTTRRDSRRNEVSALWKGQGIYQLMATAALRLTRPGWNLIAFYPGASLPPADALGTITGKYRSVYGYEDDEWKRYAPNAPAWVSNLDELKYGEGYWIDATEAITATVLPQRQADIGVLALPPATYYALLPSDIAPGQLVSATIDGQVCGATTTMAVTGGVAFVVDVLSEGSKTGCGLPGRKVTIRVGDRTYTAAWESGPYELGDYRSYLPLVQR